MLQDQLDAMLDHYGPQYPDVKRLRYEIARAKTAEAREATEGPQEQPERRRRRAGWREETRRLSNPVEVGQAANAWRC